VLQKPDILTSYQHAKLGFTPWGGSDNFKSKMDTRLIQTQTQKLILSPQIRQYLKLLQVPLAELQNVIEQEMTENPALEETAQGTLEELPSSQAADDESGKNDRVAEELRFENSLDMLDQLDESINYTFSSQEDLSLPETRELNKQKNYQESLITPKESLFDYLAWQLGFLELTEKEREIAQGIIGNLTEEGYLETPLEELAKTCSVSLQEVEKVLASVQSLDPPGIAAGNLQETMLLQLEKKGPEAELAKTIVREHLPFLEKKQWDQIAKRVKASPKEIEKAAKLISLLEPKPGRSFYAEDTVAVTPDASVYYDDTEENKLIVEVHDEDVPELRISPYYRRLLKDPKLDAASRQFLKQKIQSAIDFVKALGQRRSTLREITEEIVRAQTEFFEKGFSQLKPLRLKDIAERLGIHESTVSRAIQGKYLSTPQGTLPYKSFFSSKLETAEGGAESQKSMMEKIRELIHSEDPQNPLSDQAIMEILKKEGFRIARRTVAKYRELLKMLPSHLRKRK